MLEIANNPHKPNNQLCDENFSDCNFELRTFSSGARVNHDDININYLIFCHTGHIRIKSTLFHDEILCAGEIMFVPQQIDCNGVALSDSVLLIHQFKNTIYDETNCILYYLYLHRHIQTKRYCCKLSACSSFIALMENIIAYIHNNTSASTLWRIKHKELVWIFIHHYTPEELCAFFQPMCDEQVPFKSLVLTHYRKAEYTDILAELCGYGIYTFRRIFKKEFGVSPHKWLSMKRAEHINYRLSFEYIPFADIIEEFNLSSPQQFNRFCSNNLGNSPSSLRKRHIEEAKNREVAREQQDMKTPETSNGSGQ